jgi:hypothetical protein
MEKFKLRLLLLIIYSFALFALDRVGISLGVLDFHPFFYLLVVLALVATIVFPILRNTPLYVVVTLWGGIYLVYEFSSRWSSIIAGNEFQLTVIELLLLEASVLLVRELGEGIDDLERTIEEYSFVIFPARVIDLKDAGEPIKLELTRSRRHNRPLTVVVAECNEDITQNLRGEGSGNIQFDLTGRFVLARLAQVIDEQARQTDLIMLDNKSGHFVLLCSDTDLDSSTVLVRRIEEIVKEKLNLQTHWGAAAFPNDGLTFEDLLRVANVRLVDSTRGKPYVTSLLADASEPLVSTKE